MDCGDAEYGLEDLRMQIEAVREQFGRITSTVNDLEEVVQCMHDGVDKLNNEITDEFESVIEGVKEMGSGHGILERTLSDAERRSQDNSDFFLQKLFETDFLSMPLPSLSTIMKQTFLYCMEFFKILFDTVNQLTHRGGEILVENAQSLWLRINEDERVRSVVTGITERIGFGVDRLKHLKWFQDICEKLDMFRAHVHREFEFDEAEALRLLEELSPPDSTSDIFKEINETFRLVVAFVCVRKRPDFLTSLRGHQQDALVETLFGSDPSSAVSVGADNEMDRSGTTKSAAADNDATATNDGSNVAESDASVATAAESDVNATDAEENGEKDSMATSERQESPENLENITNSKISEQATSDHRTDRPCSENFYEENKDDPDEEMNT